MAEAMDIQVAEHIKDTADQMGYTTMLEPSSQNRGAFTWLPFRSWFREPQYGPDFIIKCGDRQIAIEVRTRPVLLWGVMQASQYAERSGAKTVICMPDAVYPEVPESVIKFAGDQDVVLCSLSGIEEILGESCE